MNPIAQSPKESFDLRIASAFSGSAAIESVGEGTSYQSTADLYNSQLSPSSTSTATEILDIPEAEASYDDITEATSSMIMLDFVVSV